MNSIYQKSHYYSVFTHPKLKNLSTVFSLQLQLIASYNYTCI
jgi:hypothetical protein